MVLQLIQFAEDMLDMIRTRHRVIVLKGVEGHAMLVRRGGVNRQESVLIIKGLGIFNLLLRVRSFER